MAERRMFAKSIAMSDAFLDMPASARCLYFTLGLLADDDGFVNSPRSIMRQIAASQDDMNILIAKKFVLVFESGVVVIKHWRIHNYIQADRYHETKCLEEKAQLSLDETKSYILGAMDTPCIQDVSNMEAGCIQDVSNMDTQDRLGKDRTVQDRKGKSNKRSASASRKKALDAVYADAPEEIHESMKAFEEMRKTIKAPLTERAFRMIIKKATELATGDVPTINAILDQSTMNGWKSVYELKASKQIDHCRDPF